MGHPWADRGTVTHLVSAVLREFSRWEMGERPVTFSEPSGGLRETAHMGGTSVASDQAGTQ